MTEVEILREALERIKAKSEMWQQAAQSTASAKAVPPWWNLGDIAAAALKKAAQQAVAQPTRLHVAQSSEAVPGVVGEIEELWEDTAGG